MGNDPLDVDYNVDVGGDEGAGGGAADDANDFGGTTADEREARRAEAEDYIPPDDRRERSRGSGDDEHEESPEDRDDDRGRRDVGRERAARDARETRGREDDRGGRRERGRKPGDLPEHRFDQLNAKFDRTMRLLEGQLQSERRQNRRLRMALGMDERPEPRRYTEREMRIRTQLERTYPELSLLSNRRLHQLLERYEDLDRIVTEYPERGREETRRWGGHAERMVRSALNHAAGQWLGQGKTFQDLADDDRDEIDHAFSRWVTRRAEQEEKDLPDGHYGETTLRYEAGDPSLVTEFWTWFTRRHGRAAGPGGQRREGAAAAARAEAASRTARGGSSSAPMGSARREARKATLDDAVDEAWESVRNTRAGA
jgi:hypothetical protein